MLCDCSAWGYHINKQYGTHAAVPDPFAARGVKGELCMLLLVAFATGVSKLDFLLVALPLI